MNDRGRTCPLSYHYRPENLTTPKATLTCSTLYVVGGLYGNTSALTALIARVDADDDTAPVIVFNGDFHYLDASPSTFRAIGETVAAHYATQGNIEAELTSSNRSAGCGCGYPVYVDDGIVARSNAIVDRLYRTAERSSDLVAHLSNLPRFLTAEVAGHRVGVIHGDPESLSGWGLALEAMEPGEPAVREQLRWSGSPTTQKTVCEWFRRSEVRVFASTHTGLPYAQDFLIGGSRHLVINNGTAGMGNYRSSTFGVVTRLSAQQEPPADSLYGTTLDGLRCDALPIEYDVDEWATVFRNNWPAGSPADVSYWDRIVNGTFLRVEHSIRGSVA